MDKCETCGHAFTEHDLTHAKGLPLGYEIGKTITSCCDCSPEAVKYNRPKVGIDEDFLKKVIRTIKDNPELHKHVDLSGKFKPAVHALEDAAGNHAFDDYPELFNITKDEGHSIRAFFQRYQPRYDEKVFALIEKIINEA